MQGWQTKYQAEVVKQMTTTRQQVEETAVLPRGRYASPPRCRRVAPAQGVRFVGWCGWSAQGRYETKIDKLERKAEAYHTELLGKNRQVL